MTDSSLTSNHKKVKIFQTALIFSLLTSTVEGLFIFLTAALVNSYQFTTGYTLMRDLFFSIAQFLIPTFIIGCYFARQWKTHPLRPGWIASTSAAFALPVTFIFIALLLGYEQLQKGLSVAEMLDQQPPQILIAAIFTAFITALLAFICAQIIMTIDRWRKADAAE